MSKALLYTIIVSCIIWIIAVPWLPKSYDERMISKEWHSLFVSVVVFAAIIWIMPFSTDLSVYLQQYNSTIVYRGIFTAALLVLYGFGAAVYALMLHIRKQRMSK